MKSTLGSFGLVPAIGLVLGAGSPSVSQAALACTAGNIAGAGICTETVAFLSKTDFSAGLRMSQSC